MRASEIIRKDFLKYLLASVMTVAATQLASIADATVVGHIMGGEALAAVNLCKPMIQAVYAFTMLYVASASMLTGMALGNKDRRQANNYFSLCVWVTLAFGVVFTVSGHVFFDRISHILCSSDTLRPLVDDYLLVTINSILPSLLMLTIQQFITVDGSPSLVTAGVIIGNILNISLDVVFMKFFGMGIAGAAYATLCMIILSILIMLIHFRKKDSLRMCRPTLREGMVSRLLSLGLPIFFSTSLLSVQMVVSNTIAFRFMGDAGVITLAVCMQVVLFSMIILNGTLRTIQPLGAKLIGMKHHKAMLALMKKAYLFLFGCLLLFVPFVVASPKWVALLLGVGQPDYLAQIEVALPAFTVNIVLQAVLFNLMPVYQFYRHNRIALFLSISQALMPVVCFYFMKGSWLAFGAGQAITLAIVIICTECVRQRQKGLYPVFLIPRRRANVAS